jgi:hypothetical protein
VPSFRRVSRSLAGQMRDTVRCGDLT